MSDATRILALLTRAEEAASACLEAAHENGVYYGQVGFYKADTLTLENVAYSRLKAALADIREILKVRQP